MSQLRKLWVIALLCISSIMQASETGTLSLFAFEDGKPLSAIEVIIDSKESYKTDKDGALEIYLETGTHKVEIITKNVKGSNLGYFRKPITIKNERDTLVTATFRSDGKNLIDIDTPLDGFYNEIKSTGEGILNGTVLSSDKAKPISNARIFVKGTDIDVRSDKDGKFSVSIPSDVNISISVIHSEYSAQSVNTILVKKDTASSIKVELTPASLELEEFIVLAPKMTGSIASVMAQEKEINAIANILGAEEMKKKGDSDAASALKRVTGVTIIGGKEIYVRGLGGRYSNVEMNSMPLPSPDPLKRTVPLDIFPAAVIESMKVQKSGTADIPASFGGGYVDIRTKDSSTEDYIKVSFEGKANSNTGKSVSGYQGSDSDFIAFDDGYRNISSDILDNSQVVVGERMQAFTTDYFTKEELSKFTQESANRNYNISKNRLPAGFKATVEGSKNIDIADGHTLSLFGNYQYNQEHKYREEHYAKYGMDKTTGDLYENPNQEGITRKTNSEYGHALMFNVGYNYHDVFKIKYTKLYTQVAEDNTRIVDGVMGSNDEDMSRYFLDWEERTLNTDQISGQFDYQIYNKKSNFRFALENSVAKLNQPNNYSYTYLNEGEPFLNNKVSNNISNQLTSEDTLNAFYLQNKINIPMLSEDDYIDVGLSMSSKERESRQNKYFLRKMGGSAIVDDRELTGDIEGIYDEYVRPDIEYDDRAFLISQLFKPADWYDAEVDETTLYANMFLKPIKSVEVLFGARQVDFKQVVYQYEEDRENPDMSKRRLIQRIPQELTLNQLYPSASLKYKVDKNNHIDLAYSNTYVVPDLREFTEGEYFHPYDVATIIGNPDLVNTDIMNLDLKYSHYFSDTENIKIGAFYKYLDKPIEDVMVPSSSLPIYSFDNADFATLYGIELDGRKNLDFIYSGLRNYYFSGNFSYTESDVTLREEQVSTYSTNNRQLQGLSPLVVNATLGYDEKMRSLSLSYNKMGERIRKVGMVDDGDAFPDYYEVPPAILDFVWIEKFNNGVTCRLKLKNLLDQETIWKQGNRVTNRFKTGREYSITVAYKY